MKSSSATDSGSAATAATRRCMLGKAIRIDGADFTVVGVMPHDFEWQFWSDGANSGFPVGYTKTDFGRGDNSFISPSPVETRRERGAGANGDGSLGSRVPEAISRGRREHGRHRETDGDFGMEGIRRRC